MSKTENYIKHTVTVNLTGDKQNVQEKKAGFENRT